MSTNKLSHLKEGEKIYLEVTRIMAMGDDGRSMCFETNCMNSIWVNDGDTFYTLEELKALANDGMPKQGDENVSGKEAKVTIDGKEYSVTLKLI